MYSGYIVSNPVCMLVQSDCPYRLDKMGNPIENYSQIVCF